MSGLDPRLVEQVSYKLIQNTERSFLEDTEETARTHKRKWKSYRICPVCGKEIGNFGGNFKNHFKKCCPPVFDCIESINHSYFGTYEGCLAQGLVSGDGRWTVPPLDLNEDEVLAPTWRYLVNSSPFNGGGTPRRRDDRRNRRRNQYTECPSCRQPISARTNYLTHLQMCNYQLYMQILNSASHSQTSSQDGSYYGSETSMFPPSPSGPPPSPFTSSQDGFSPSFEGSRSQPPSPMMFPPPGSSSSSSFPQMPFGVPFSPGVMPQKLPFASPPRQIEPQPSQWDYMEDNKDYEPWEWWLKNTAINRYMSNARFLKELFCEENADKLNIKPKSSTQQRKEALQKQLQQVDSEIEELENENQLTLERKESERQKFIEYFAQLSRCSGSEDLLQVKQNFERDFGCEIDDGKMYSGSSSDRTASSSSSSRKRSAEHEPEDGDEDEDEDEDVNTTMSPLSSSSEPPRKRQRSNDDSVPIEEDGEDKDKDKEEKEDLLNSKKEEDDGLRSQKYVLRIRRITDTIDKTSISRLENPSLLNL
eukprot:gb/GECH01015017.1/.p1 GENE.gb/GECH01015017.1/~~gb/GECH01015017.1/.p1  ORF type:complete len:534 (+),score=139.71 gb/GECH01015017.1/:1-1602(+)